jgi:hypothetical protein
MGTTLTTGEVSVLYTGVGWRWTVQVIPPKEKSFVGPLARAKLISSTEERTEEEAEQDAYDWCHQLGIIPVKLETGNCLEQEGD